MQGRCRAGVPGLLLEATSTPQRPRRDAAPRPGWRRRRRGPAGLGRHGAQLRPP